MAGDRILAVDGQPVDSWEELSGTISQKPEQEIEVTVLRDGVEKSFRVFTARDENNTGKLGIYPEQGLSKGNLFQALALGADYTARITWMILDFVAKMILGQTPADVGGPVRVVSEIGKAAQVGFFFLLQLSAFLSINLGLFNLFPIPALDGSRILFLFWEKVRGRPVDPVKSYSSDWFRPAAAADRGYYLMTFCRFLSENTFTALRTLPDYNFCCTISSKNSNPLIKTSRWFTLRRITRPVFLGRVQVGGGACSVQSMTNTDTRDVRATLKQMKSWWRKAVKLFVWPYRTSKRRTLPPSRLLIPVIADIHFDHRLALESSRPASGLRINPGNIGGRNRVVEVVAAARAKCSHQDWRNAGSLEKGF